MAAARTVAELVDDLRVLGVGTGDVLIVHASLKAIGPVDGGPRGVVQALDGAVGESGTVVMVLGWNDSWDWVNREPAHLREALLDSAPVFDPWRDGADPDVGTLAEVFRTREGTRVSIYPDGRFGARGAMADELLADPPWDDYYGPGSTLDRLVRAGGRLLRLGADPDTVTLIHFAEYLVDLPDKRRITRHHRVLGPDGEPQVREVSCLDDSGGIVEWSGTGEQDYFALILRDFLATGRARTGLVGAARSELIEAADIVSFAADWMTQRFAPAQPS